MSAPQAPARIGRYRVLGELGRGAMGIVYRAEDEKLGRPVAIKTVLVTLETEEADGYLARFRQEARALGALNHPAIITVHEYGDEGDLAYMVMELLEGRELRRLLQEGAMAPAAAAEIAAQVAAGLAYAHSRGIVHRDVKPSNIMVLDGNRAKVMDFGIARVRASDVKTQTGFMLGSPKYMSPEQVVGRAVDGRSDLFSLGVVLCEMLTGRAPFHGADVHTLMFDICNGRHVPPSHTNPAIPEVLDLIVARALEKAPEARYQDGEAMARDLRECLAQLPREAARLRTAEAIPAARPAAVARPTADSADADRTVARTAPLEASATLRPATIGLPPWRRFDSALALERLAGARGEDRRSLSPEACAAGRWSRLQRDRWLLARAAALAAATAAALAIIAA